MKESVENLRTAGEAFEDKGYEVISYNVTGYYGSKTVGSGDEPEEAFDEYLKEMEEEKMIEDTFINTGPVLDLFLRGSEEDVEAAVNETLRQVDAGFRLKDPEDEKSPVPYVQIRYTPQLDEGVFRFIGGAEGKYPRTEFTEILQEEGFKLDENH